MKISAKLYYLIIIPLLSVKGGFCQQVDDCKGIVNRKDKITAVLQQSFSDSMISGSLHIKLVCELNKPMNLTFYVEDYDYPLSEKDSLGLLNYISPYDLRDGMDVLFNFSGKDSLLIDGKRTLENLVPLYKSRMEEEQVFAPPPKYPGNIRSIFFLAYNTPLTEKDVDLLLTKRLKDIVIKNSKIRFSISLKNARQLKKLMNCLIINKPS